MSQEKFLLDSIKILSEENEYLKNQLEIVTRTLENTVNLAGKLAENSAKTGKKEVESCEKHSGKYFKCPCCREVSFVGAALVDCQNFCRKCGAILQPLEPQNPKKSGQKIYLNAHFRKTS